MKLSIPTWALMALIVPTALSLATEPVSNDDPNATFSILPTSETQAATANATVTAPAVLPPKVVPPPSGFVTIVTATAPTAVPAREKRADVIASHEEPTSEEPVGKESATYDDPATLSEQELLAALETIAALAALENEHPADSDDDDDYDENGKKKLFKPQPEDEPDPQNKNGHKHPTFDNSGEPFCFRWPGGDKDADDAAWNYAPKCPNGDNPTFSWRCTVLNVPYFEPKKNYRTYRWFKCPGLVKDW